MRDDHARSSRRRDTGTAAGADPHSNHDRVRVPHPGAGYEALPDDAARPTEVTIRPRYAEDASTAWVSARIEDTRSLVDSR